MRFNDNKFTAAELEQFVDKYINYFRNVFNISEEADFRFSDGYFASDRDTLGLNMDCVEYCITAKLVND